MKIFQTIMVNISLSDEEEARLNNPNNPEHEFEMIKDNTDIIKTVTRSDLDKIRRGLTTLGFGVTIIFSEAN